MYRRSSAARVVPSEADVGALPVWSPSRGGAGLSTVSRRTVDRTGPATLHRPGESREADPAAGPEPRPSPVRKHRIGHSATAEPGARSRHRQWVTPAAPIALEHLHRARRRPT